MNKKGYTLIELLAVVIILAILIGFAIMPYSRYLNKSKDKAFNILISNVTDATKTFYSNCNNELLNQSDLCSLYKLKNKGDKTKIYINDLKKENLLEKIDNPYGSGECSGYVNVTLTDDIQLTYDIKTCLTCGSHSSNGCNN